ncbi:MAG: hypothetical protein IJQ32_09135 [Paludibacteraceae bacterium]|nr:hypothetical protein [Paludibacteraceae bacterium]
MKKIFTLFCLFCAMSAQATQMSADPGVYNGSVTIGGTKYSAERIYVLPGAEANTLTCVVGEQVLVNIPASSVVLSAQAVSGNYAIANGGFEGSWSNNEPTGWHSFASATGDYASFVTSNTEQFQQSTDKRPGSAGSYSAQIQSKVTFGVKANGNVTNGRINAGSMTADDSEGNYAFSDPSGNNTPFVGQPDSLVFWAKYIPGGGNVTDASNQARAHATLTTNARYQDPESGNYSSARIADATANYYATSDKGWQRISVPFVYTSKDPSQIAYMLITFTTNKTPGGGNATKKSPDNVYIDDAEMIYNYRLTQLTIDGEAISFTNGQATTDKMFSRDYVVKATTNGKAAKTFVGYDEANYRMCIYVVPDNYSQAHAYTLYTVQMAEPIKDTEYAYSASTCDNEPYSDELFTNLTKSGEYKTTIPNTQGGDSLITLTLTVNKTYAFHAEASMKMNEEYTWREKTYENLTPGVHQFADELKTKAGCDSVYTLTLRVEAIGYLFEESLSACVNEDSEWHGKTLPTAQTGTFVVYDSLKSEYGKDSVYVLTLTVHPIYFISEEKYMNEANLVWRGKTIQDLPKRQEPYLIYDSLRSQYGCDSVYMLRLHVSDLPITYGSYSDECCEGEFILFDGVEYRESFDGEVRISERNIYGGDSIVRLTITVFPSYFIEEQLTIVVGEERSWEYYDLSQFPIGSTTLKAEYWSDDFCDSIRVLYLTVEPEPISTGVTNIRMEKDAARKVLYRGRMYIIRKDENIYDVLGNKIQ